MVEFPGNPTTLGTAFGHYELMDGKVLSKGRLSDVSFHEVVRYQQDFGFQDRDGISETIIQE